MGGDLHDLFGMVSGRKGTTACVLLPSWNETNVGIGTGGTEGQVKTCSQVCFPLPWEEEILHILNTVWP